MTDAVAVVGGRLLTGLRDLTGDLSALDSDGFWAVVVAFDGQAVCARFDRVRPARPWPGEPWRGPSLHGWTSSMDGRTYRAGVVAIRQAIADGDVYEVNLCRVLSAPLPMPPPDIAALGGVLAEGNPAPYSAIVRLPTAGIFVASASPERFLRRDGDWVESSPIKGTAATADGFADKDRAENVMIVDLVRNDLGRVCDYGTITVPGLCQLEAHPGLFHLVSTIRGRLRAGVTWAELLDATFPPGSVTGAPKLASLRMIAALEPDSRGPYCGAIGWVDADRGQADMNVAIRTFWMDASGLHFGTGAAITWDSTPEGEWSETALKAQRLIALASARPPNLELVVGQPHREQPG